MGRTQRGMQERDKGINGSLRRGCFSDDRSVR